MHCTERTRQMFDPKPSPLSFPPTDLGRAELELHRAARGFARAKHPSRKDVRAGERCHPSVHTLAEAATRYYRADLAALRGNDPRIAYVHRIAIAAEHRHHLRELLDVDAGVGADEQPWDPTSLSLLVEAFLFLIPEDQLDVLVERAARIVTAARDLSRELAGLEQRDLEQRDLEASNLEAC